MSQLPVSDGLFLNKYAFLSSVSGVVDNKTSPNSFTFCPSFCDPLALTIETSYHVTSPIPYFGVLLPFENS